MQRVRLESKDRGLVAEVELPTSGEPEAIIFAERVFVRRPMQILEPPTKNSPEIYEEINTLRVATAAPNRAPAFDRVTETIPQAAKRKTSPEQEDEEEEDPYNTLLHGDRRRRAS